MLSRVAEGNDPRNFVFVLNKADQLRGDKAAITEIRDDYAVRVGAATGMEPPRVWVVSAREPAAYDLPELQRAVTRKRSRDEVVQASQLAGQQRDRSLIAWMATQDLPERADRLGRLRNDTEELLAARVVGPLLEQSLPRLANDPIHRASLIDEATGVRVARWPLVNLVHSLLSPLLIALLAIVRGGAAVRALGSGGGWIDAYLTLNGRPMHEVLQATFAHVRQTSPAVATIFTHRKLWDDRDAELAVIQLRSALIDTVDRQRAHVLARYGKSRNPLAALVRWTLTIGALLWLPFVQPLLEAALQPGFARTGQELGLLVVRILGTTYLLTTVSFLVIYFVVLWLALRWTTGRRVSRWLERWSTGAGPAELDLSRQSLDWASALTEPLRIAHVRTQAVASELEKARQVVGKRD